MQGKDYLHQLIDALPDTLVGQVADFTEFVTQRSRALAAERLEAAIAALPEDDEEIDDETWARIRAAEAEDGATPYNHVKAELGL